LLQALGTGVKFVNAGICHTNTRSAETGYLGTFMCKGRLHQRICDLAEALGCGLQVRYAKTVNPLDGIGFRLIIIGQGCTALQVSLLRRYHAQAAIVMLDSDCSQFAAMQALRNGADDYICTNLCDSAIAERISQQLDVSRDIIKTTGSPGDYGADMGWIGVSSAAQRTRDMVRKIAPNNSTVLIEGDTGTGKDIIAVALHKASKRAAKAIVAINCAAIPDAMIEGELFGYRKGAFTGATQNFSGKILMGDKGTIFLDEVGELSLAAQSKLLRVLENREVTQLGCTQSRRIDVRIIAATNRNLEAAVAQGLFRADLYYRLAIVRLRLPALALRKEDIAPISAYLIRKIAAENGLVVPQIMPELYTVLCSYDWPGNVRQLRNILEHTLITARRPDHLCAADLPEYIRAQPCTTEVCSAAFAATAHNERDILLAALATSAGKKTQAARILNCSRMTLYRRLERAGLAPMSALAQHHNV
jgi:transcriptional regulator with PAS, ATPase and Fis domain